MRNLRTMHFPRGFSASHIVVLFLAVAVPFRLVVAVEEVNVPEGETYVLDASQSAGEAKHINLRGGTLKLVSGADATLATAGVNANKSNGVATLEVASTGAAPRILTLSGTLSIGTYTTVQVNSVNHSTLALPCVASTQSGPALKPGNTDVAVCTMSGNITLDGTTSGNTLGIFTGTTLQKQNTGTWTLTGNNSAQTWNAAINGGNFVLKSGAAFSSGGMSVESTFSPEAGTCMKGRLSLRNGAILNLADGKIGTFTVGVLDGPNGGEETVKFDLDGSRVDHLIIGDVSDSNSIKGRVVLNPLSKRLTPGTYRLVTLTAKERTLMEHHFAFDFTGPPADHLNMVMTQVANGYTFTLAPVEEGGLWTGLTLTISAAP